MDGLSKNLLDIDKAISWYLKSNEIVETECGYVNSKLTDSRKFSEYETRRTNIRRNYETNCLKLMESFNKITKNFHCLNFDDYLKKTPYFFLRQFFIGKLRVKYENLDKTISMPLTIPVKKSICAEISQKDYILQFMMNLLFTLPPRLCQFYIYDPNHFGSSVGRFDILREVEEVFPNKKFLCNDKELKQLLDEITEDFSKMLQETFPAKNCRSWTEYNRQMRAENKPAKQLPYKILVCFELPELCTPEILSTLNRLSGEGERSGFLLLFTYDKKIFTAEKHPFDGTVAAYQNDRSIIALKSLCEKSVQLSNAFVQMNELKNLEYLRLEEKIQESLPEHTMEKYLREYKKLLETHQREIISFDELISAENTFVEKAINGLKIPIGSSTDNGEILNLEIGDQPPHTMIAGATGSGKSNLLHVLITSACSRYSPDELNLYLIDFKDGVEFAAYTHPCLPHAKLVAIQADAEYVQSVLAHLAEEILNRNNIFKKNNCKDYMDFRKENPTQILPRIILIVDEFQRIFEADSNAVTDILSILTKQGRSAGVHLIFATQTFKGIGGNTAANLGFSQLKGQFGARIALKCSSDDSKDILGQNNDAAVELKIPYAILNTDGGGLKYNKKFAVPESKAEKVADTIKKLLNLAGNKAVLTKVFEGQKLPQIPPYSEFAKNDFTFLFGRNLKYSAEYFSVTLKNLAEENLVICSQEDIFFKCVVNFGRVSKIFDEVVYIGKNPVDGFKNFTEPKEFFDAVKANKFDLRRLIILDACKFPKISYAPKPDELEFSNFWSELSENGSHVVAFYKTINKMKDNNFDLKICAHKISYHQPQSQLNQFGGIQLGSKIIDDRFKAAYYYSERIQWFQPFSGVDFNE